MPKNNSPERKAQRIQRVIDRQATYEWYPCEHMHVPGNQHFCPVYKYEKQQ